MDWTSATSAEHNGKGSRKMSNVSSRLVSNHDRPITHATQPRAPLLSPARTHARDETGRETLGACPLPPAPPCARLATTPGRRRAA